MNKKSRQVMSCKVRHRVFKFQWAYAIPDVSGQALTGHGIKKADPPKADRLLQVCFNYI
jgi:hypothetical protein